MKLKISKLNEIDLKEKDIDEVCNFCKFCIAKLKIEGDVCVRLVGKTDDTMGMSTGGFDVFSNDISARAHGRALVDVLRSICHELVHYKQKEVKKFNPGDNIPNIGGEIEDEANALCGQLVKMYVHEKDKKYLYTY
jgi:hypothetical protein